MSEMLGRLHGDLEDARSEERDIARVYVDDLRAALKQIARLTRERDAARDALEPFAARVRDDGSIVSGRIPDDDLRQARAALSPSESPRP
jgi:hypothetical protein